MKLYLPSPYKLFKLETGVALYFFALLLFGKEFTKFNIFGPLYLHDLVLFLLVLLAINNRRKLTIRFGFVIAVIVLSLIYLILSFIVYKPQGDLLIITLRQYNIFTYLICIYVLFNTLIKNERDLNRGIHFVKLISKSSVVLQIVFLAYGFLFIKGFSLTGQNDYKYFSPLVIFGIICYGASVLTFESRVILKWLKFVFAIFLSLTLGHSSAFLSLFFILVIYIFTYIKPLQRFIALGFVLIAISALLFLPQFNDVNASWRLFYWKHVVSRLYHEKYLFFGYGFGQPYMTYEYALYLKRELNSPGMLAPMERYLSPPHNSPLAISFHIGLTGLILLLLQLRSLFTQVFFKSHYPSRELRFITLALMGSIIWISFNVILELPHSATFFWMIYLLCCLGYKLKNNMQSGV